MSAVGLSLAGEDDKALASAQEYDDLKVVMTKSSSRGELRLADEEARAAAAERAAPEVAVLGQHDQVEAERVLHQLSVTLVAEARLRRGDHPVSAAAKEVDEFERCALVSEEG